MDNPVNVVCEAIHALYSGGPETAKAQKFLQTFQESQDSWMICDQIIGNHTDSLACYFASQTLRTKILKNFKELPPESYESLRHSLLQHLNRHGAFAHDAQSEATSTQLCLAIADLYIQVPFWNNWIAELLNQCQALEGDRTIMTLTLLHVFPEEVDEIRGIGENRRTAIRQELAACEKAMIEFLSHVLAKYQADYAMLKRVLKCLETNISNKLMPTDSLSESPLLQFVFEILVSKSEIPSTLFEAATNVIVAALYRVEDVENHEKLAKVLQTGIVQHLPAAFKSAEQEEDYDKLQSISRIFVELCESFYIQIASEPATDPSHIGSLVCLELLLLIASHHEYSLVEMTFSVWYRITEELFKFDNDDYFKPYKPYAEKFIMALFEHSKFDPDSGSDWPNEQSDFADFRYKVVEAVRDIVFIVNTETCIEMMFKVLQENSQKGNSWETAESALFIISCVVQNLLPEIENNVMPHVISSIISLPPSSPPQIILTSFTLLADCNDYFVYNSKYIEPALKWVLQFSMEPRYAPYATSCVESIAMKCSIFMVSFLPDLMKLITILESTTTNGVKIEEAIVNTTRACSNIIYILPQEKIKENMEHLCGPVIMNLNKAIELSSNENGSSMNNNNNNNNTNGNSSENKENISNKHSSSTAWAIVAKQPIVWIDRIASIFKDIWKPIDKVGIEWVDVAKQLFDVLVFAMRKFETNVRTVEHIIRSIRFIFRSLGPHSKVIVESIFLLLMDVYPRNRHSCLLYMASIVVDEYGTNFAMQPALIHMLQILSKAAFELLEQPNGCMYNPDTVDDLYRLAQRFVARAPSRFFISPVANSLFCLAVKNLDLKHHDANKSLTKFLSEIIEQLYKARKNKYFDDGVKEATHLIENHGASLLSASLMASVFHLGEDLQRDMAEIVHLIGKLDRNKQKEWLVFAVSSLPNEPMKATPLQLETFVQDVTKSRDSYQVSKIIKELKILFH